MQYLCQIPAGGSFNLEAAALTTAISWRCWARTHIPPALTTAISWRCWARTHIRRFGNWVGGAKSV